MTKQEKTQAIAELKESFENHQFFYVADASSMSVEQVNRLRGICFEKGVTMKVVKNTLAIKALEALPAEAGYEPIYPALKGPSAILFSQAGNTPAKVIKEFREPKGERPVLKAAYIDSDVFLGDDKLAMLSELKSKEDLIGDVILLLQSPIKNVLGSLNSGANTIGGLLKTLEERAQS